jgi:hypothetical protein
MLPCGKKVSIPELHQSISYVLEFTGGTVVAENHEHVFHSEKCTDGVAP